LVLWSVRKRPMAIMRNVLLAARSPSAIEPMMDGLSQRRRNWAGAVSRCEAAFRSQSFGIVAGRKKKLGGSNLADRTVLGGHSRAEHRANAAVLDHKHDGAADPPIVHPPDPSESGKYVQSDPSEPATAEANQPGRSLQASPMNRTIPRSART
jgi:hypothetical protein